MASDVAVAMLCHPVTPIDAVQAIEVRLSRPAGGSLGLLFRLAGDVRQILVPAARPPRVAHQLWEHTCFEAFIAADGATAYHELNFAPSGEWAGYCFSAYREIAGLVDEALAPPIVVRSTPTHLELEASLALDHLSSAYRDAALEIGLSAVIERLDGSLSYWSLHHPPGRPDFHHHDARAVRLPT